MGVGAHLYTMTHWESCGSYYVNDVKNLTGRSAKWYTPMRILNMTVDEYIQLLLKYKATEIKYYAPTDCLTFHFKTEADAKAFCKFINNKAKVRNYICY